MKKHLFWLLVAVVAGVLAHAAFALFVPGWWFSREVGKLAEAHGRNSFFILSPQEQAKLFPGLPRFGVTGVCLFDVGKGSGAAGPIVETDDVEMIRGAERLTLSFNRS